MEIIQNHHYRNVVYISTRYTDKFLIENLIQHDTLDSAFDTIYTQIIYIYIIQKISYNTIHWILLGTSQCRLQLICRLGCNVTAMRRSDRMPIVGDSLMYLIGKLVCIDEWFLIEGQLCVTLGVPLMMEYMYPTIKMLQSTLLHK